MTPPDTRFARYREAIAKLTTAFPDVHAVLRPGEDVATLDGWAAMAKRAVQQGDEPAVVATLYGPSGAGKSTLFRRLTGLDVPIDVLRPCTRAAFVATPPALAETDRLRPYFGDAPLRCLEEEDRGRLREPGAGDTLFYRVSTRLGSGGEGPLLMVADVPDFDSVEEENKAVCERMRDRAEVVVFVASAKSYFNRETLLQLAKCCGLAANLVVVLTQLEREAAAGEIWADLTGTVIGSKEWRSEFAMPRADGTSRAAFLRDCPVFFTVLSDDPAREDAIPLSGKVKLADVLRDLDGPGAIVDGLAEAAAVAVRSCRAVVADARERYGRVHAGLAWVEESLRAAAADVARDEFPIGRLAELAREEAKGSESRTHRLIARVSSPFSISYWKTRTKEAGQFVAGGKLQNREELETGLMAKAAERMILLWRNKFPVEWNGMLSAGAWTSAREALARHAPPPPKGGWEEDARNAIREAAKSGGASLLARLGDWTAMVGGPLGAVGAIVVTGGLAAPLVIGSVVVLTSGLVSYRAGDPRGEEERLKREADARIDSGWRVQRTKELADHLRTYLADPLFRSWREDLECLRPDRIAACETACAEVEALVARPPNGFRLIGRGDGDPPAGH